MGSLDILSIIGRQRLVQRSGPKTLANAEISYIKYKLDELYEDHVLIWDIVTERHIILARLISP